MFWSRQTISDLISRAESSGEARADAASARDAQRLRFAIYGFRRRHGQGRNLSVTLDQNSVVLTRNPEIALATPEARP